MNYPTSKIAVIGMGCYYPGANNLQQLWENILTRRRQFRRTPDVRLPLSEYYDPDPTVPDKTYGSRMAVIDGFEFDWANRRIPKTAVESTDIVHWLALEVAYKAIEDAGFSRQTIPTEKTGVILGNTLTGEQTRATGMRLRWPYVRKALQTTAVAKGMSATATESLINTMEGIYKSAFATITEDSLAGGLSNTIAGRVCNFFNLDGGGYTVDGACSSSLIAVTTAAKSLACGDLDLALAGGVDISLDTFELIGFAKTGALTATDMTVYDRKASGFIPGEGCGFAVLKRLEDARRDGDYVYAVIQGWGISSDGKGGITAPSKIGQSKALRRAYDKAEYNTHDLDFIEGHGTGTPVGDRTELEGIALAVAADGEIAPRSIGVTSFKSLVGHTKAAAGIGGLIKAVMAVNQRVIPPSCGCQDPNPVFDSSAQSIYPILQGEVRQQGDILRAGVSAMGFGGINSHVTLESGDQPSEKLKSTLKPEALLVSNQDTEVFVLLADTVEALLEKTQRLATVVEDISLAEMVDLAVEISQAEISGKVRAAIVADTPMALVENLQQLEEILNDKPPAVGEMRVSPQKQIWVANNIKQCRVAFLFPGQGSQRLNMVRTLVQRYDWAREFLSEADNWLEEAGFSAISPLIYRQADRAVNKDQIKDWLKALTRADIAPPAICFASLVWKRYLNRLGIQPVAVGGHSLGELSAFQAAGGYDEKTLLVFAAMRGKAMAATEGKAGTMASLACSQTEAEKLVQGVNGYVVVANINSPKQTVISGEPKSVAEVIQRAETEGIASRPLRVANAFHSEMVASSAEFLRANAPIPDTLSQTSLSLFSSVNGELIQPGIQLREYFAQQMTSRVDFISLVNTLATQCDVMVEVGPGKVLSGLVSATTNHPMCLPVESKAGSDRDLNTLLASLFVQGSDIDWKVLYENRLVRPFIPASQKQFVVNPCEKPLQVLGNIENLPMAVDLVPTQPQLMPGSEDLLESVLSEYFSERGAFLAELIRADLESL
ncbi:MAG: type I polyketide synthase [Microcoleaceae cyanobacterium]